MLPQSEQAAPSPAAPRSRIDLRVIAGLLLLIVAGVYTRLTIEGLSARRSMRVELAEISHARYDLLNLSRWVEKITPILDAKIDALDLTASNHASLRPMVENALYRLLEAVKEKMSPKPAPGAGLGGLLGQGNSLMVNFMLGTLRPHVPEYANMVLAEIGKPENKASLKKYIRSTLAESAKTTFGNVDMTWYSYILKHYGCADVGACRQVLGDRIHQADTQIEGYYLSVLGASLVAFTLLMIGRGTLGRASVVVLLLFCLVLLVGGVLTPMLEVEARISRMAVTVLGQPIAFTDQVLYFQSKSVLEVFHTLITMGKPEMWIVGMLVLMFSIVFPLLKICALSACLFQPDWLQRNAVVRFLALESSKWSMADVMALAIFMAFVAFNGLIANTMGHLRETGAELALPTDSSKILPGYYLFIGYCLASLFLSKKLQRGIRTTSAV